MSDLAKAVGRRIRALRKARGLTQIALGEMVGVSEEWVRRIERGEGKPSLDVVEAMARALRVASVELFDRLRSAELEAVIVRIEQLQPSELTWLTGLLDQLQARPGRRKRS